MQPQRSLQKKSHSAAELRRQERWKDPHWSHVKNLSTDERKILEGSWNDRHHVHFSVLNRITHVGMRDYFDRPRDFSDPSTYSCQPTRFKAHWSLDHHPDDDGVPLAVKKGFAFGGSSSSLAGSSASGKPRRRKLPAWNDRHHVTHSEGNGKFHDSQKEYFGRFVESRADVVIPQRIHGWTAHNFPFAHPADMNGADSEPSLAEKLLLADAPGHGSLGLHPSTAPTAPSAFGRKSSGGKKMNPRATV